MIESKLGGFIATTSQIADGIITGAKLANNLNYQSVLRVNQLDFSLVVGVIDATRPQIFSNLTGAIAMHPAAGDALFIADSGGTGRKRFEEATGLLTTGALVNSEIAVAAAIAQSKLAGIVTGTVTMGANFTTTSLTLVDITGLTVTVTAVGRNILGILFVNSSNSGLGNEEGVALFIDTVKVAGSATNQYVVGNVQCICLASVAAVAAGARIVKGQAQASAGTTTVYANDPSDAASPASRVVAIEV